MKTDRMKDKNRKRMRFAATVAGLCLLFFVAACTAPQEQPASTYQVYYVNNSETGILAREYQTDITDPETLMEELLEKLGTVSEKLEYISPLAGSFTLLEHKLSEGQIMLNFDDHYNEQSVVREILVRAALVRTLTQIQGVQYVSVMIRSEPLADSTGNIIGAMSADMFIDNVGNEFNSYEKTAIQLYFGNESGDGLVAVTRNNVVYNSNVAIEKVVMENLIQGPLAEEGATAIVNPETKVVNITVQDGICYVSLDDKFASQLENVSADLTIYAITNSLVELPNVNKVQILINGSTGVVFRENVNLTTVFDRNLDIVTVR